MVKEMKVKVGDKVTEGSAHSRRGVGRAGGPRPRRSSGGSGRRALTPALARERERRASVAGSRRARRAAGRAASVSPARPTSNARCSCSAPGPGGYSAAFRSADLGMKTVLVERYATLGGVCLNVGCIPSKALLHTAATMDEVMALGAHGIALRRAADRLAKLRDFKEGVVKKLTAGLAGMAKMRKVDVVRGVGRFLDPHHLEVALTTGTGQDKSGEKKVVKFDKAIIAAGSQAMKLPFMPDDPRVVDSTGALELAAIPKRMLVVGGGIIGLEMATVYSALGTRIDVVEMLDSMMAGADRDLVKVWEKMNAPALRQGDAEDEDRVGASDAGGHQGGLRGREGAGRSRKPTTSCWSRSAAAPTAR